MCIGNRNFVNLNLHRIAYFNILTSTLIDNTRREVLNTVEDKVYGRMNCFGQNSNINALECNFAHMSSGKFKSSGCLRETCLSSVFEL